MLKDFYETIKPELITLLVTILTAFLSYAGHKIKKLYEESIKDDQKLKIVGTVVAAVQEIYSNLSNEEKYQKAKENIILMLKDKKILISDLELKLLIEEAVHCCKKEVSIK